MAYTWTTYPLSNETNFETKARAALEQWRSNAAGIEAKLGDIQSGLINAADVTIPTGKTLNASNGTVIAPRMTTAERTAITPAVGQEIYDTDLKQLAIGDGVTVGGVLQKANVAATSTNDGYATSAQITKLDGIEAGADVTDAGNIASVIHAATTKTTPVGADELAVIDSEAGNVLKKVLISDLATGSSIVSDVDATLSGTPKTFAVLDSSGTPYYFKAYPTKS